MLTVTGDANTLTAGYTDVVHDGFTDSDDIQDGWTNPDAPAAATPAPITAPTATTATKR